LRENVLHVHERWRCGGHAVVVRPGRVPVEVKRLLVVEWVHGSKPLGFHLAHSFSGKAAHDEVVNAIGPGGGFNSGIKWLRCVDHILCFLGSRIKGINSIFVLQVDGLHSLEMCSFEIDQLLGRVVVPPASVVVKFL